MSNKLGKSPHYSAKEMLWGNPPNLFETNFSKFFTNFCAYQKSRIQNSAIYETSATHLNSSSFKKSRSGAPVALEKPGFAPNWGRVIAKNKCLEVTSTQMICDVTPYCTIVRGSVRPLSRLLPGISYSGRDPSSLTYIPRFGSVPKTNPGNSQNTYGEHGSTVSALPRLI